MPGVRKFEHVELRVSALDPVIEFYGDLLGVDMTERDGDTVYLSSEPENHYDLIDDHYDVALTEGDPGIDHFAIRATDRELDETVERLAAADVEFRELDGGEPGRERGVRTELPGGLPVELVVVEKHTNPDRMEIEPPTRHHAPKGLDHITLASPSVREDTEFLRDVLDFRVSDVAMAGPDTWGMAFTRYGDYHHDVALIMEPPADRTHLHHVAWSMTDVTHMKQFVDVLGKSGHEVEIDFTRHVLGDNVSLYFPDPSGHRLEVTTEVQTLDPDTPTTFHHEDPNEIVTHWKGTHPPIGGPE